LREQVEPLAPVELQQRCFVRPDEWAALFEQLRAKDRVVPTPSGKLTHSARVEEVAERIVAAVDACHAAHAELVGISEAELAMETGGHPEIFKLALGARVGSGVLKFNGAVYHRSGWRPRVSDPEHALSERAEAAFRQAGWAPPSTEALAAALCVPVGRAEKLVRFLQDRGVLVRLDDRVTMHRDAVERGKQAALELFRRAPSFTTMAFRDALGVSRKFAVPLLDHLDKMRFTARHGHDRSPGVEAKRLLAVGN
jgi:selenocysteine-specific elongation factor